MLDDIETIVEGSKPTLFIIVIALVYTCQIMFQIQIIMVSCILLYFEGNQKYCYF